MLLSVLFDSKSKHKRADGSYAHAGMVVMKHLWDAPVSAAVNGLFQNVCKSTHAIIAATDSALATCRIVAII